MQELGWIEGKTIVLEPRFDHLERLPACAAELVQRNVDVIVAGGTLAALAANQATSTLPIVTLTAGDPVGRWRGRVVLGLGWISLGLFALYLVNTWLLYQYGH